MIVMDMLRKLQLVEIDMLRVFDRVCRKYNIPYFVDWGTALGAIRHQGFIPWDDDIDIGMLRRDYVQLKMVPENEWNGLKLIDGNSDCFYHNKVFPRIYKPGTVLETDAWKKHVYNPQSIKRPICLDLILYDFEDSKEEATKKARIAIFHNKIFFYSKYKMNIDSSDKLLEKIIAVGKNLCHFFLYKPPKYYFDCYIRSVSTYKGTGKYLISYDLGTLKHIVRSFSEYDDIFPTQELMFEGFKVKVPHRIEKQLKNRYGDYMELPPEEQRVGHLPQSVYLGDD